MGAKRASRKTRQNFSNVVQLHNFNKKSIVNILPRNRNQESYMLKFPAISLRPNHERPESIDSGSLYFSTPHSTALISSARLALTNKLTPSSNPDYEVPCVSQKIVSIVSGYSSWVSSEHYRQS